MRWAVKSANASTRNLVLPWIPAINSASMGFRSAKLVAQDVVARGVHPLTAVERNARMVLKLTTEGVSYASAKVNWGIPRLKILWCFQVEVVFNGAVYFERLWSGHIILILFLICGALKSAFSGFVFYHIIYLRSSVCLKKGEGEANEKLSSFDHFDFILPKFL